MSVPEVLLRRLIPIVLLLGVVGCEQASAPPAPPPPPPPPPVVVTPAEEMPAPEPPPQKTANEIIDEFLALRPHERTDAHLLALAELPEGLQRITELDLTKSRVTDEGLATLPAFPRLKTLILNGCRFTNAGLKKLPECETLQVLQLQDAPVDSGAMIYVGQLPQLKTLNVAGTAISDAGFVALKDLKNLEMLSVDNNPNLMGKEFGRLVGEGAFAQLKELTASQTRLSTYGVDTIDHLDHLQVFRGSGSGVTDQVLTSLGKCKDLRVLDISNSSVTSIGMKKLTKLDQLEELNLRECRAIADIAFNVLKGSKSLRVLNVNQTSCTLPAVQLLADKYLVDTEILFGGQSY